MTVRRFPIRLGRKSRPLLLLFGVRQANAYVEINAELDARFGFYRLRTPLENVTRWRIEGPWSWITAIGVRRSIRGSDVTFGGNHGGGVRIDFRVRPRLWVFRPSALYVTVADMDGFAAALRERGIPGEDVRKVRDEPAASVDDGSP